MVLNPWVAITFIKQGDKNKVIDSLNLFNKSMNRFKVFEPVREFFEIAKLTCPEDDDVLRIKQLKSLCEITQIVLKTAYHLANKKNKFKDHQSQKITEDIIFHFIIITFMIISIKSNLKHNETYYCLRKQKLTKISKPSNFACKHTVYAEQFIIKFDQNITKLNNDVQNQINSDIARVIKNQTLQDHSIQKSLLQDLTHFNKKLSEVENGYIGSIFFQLEKEMILKPITKYS